MLVEAAPVVEAGERVVERFVQEAVEAQRDLAQLADGVELLGVVEDGRLGVDADASSEDRRRHHVEVERSTPGVEELEAEDAVVEHGVGFAQVVVLHDAVEGRRDERDAGWRGCQLTDEVGEERAGFGVTRGLLPSLRQLASSVHRQ